MKPSKLVKLVKLQKLNSFLIVRKPFLGQLQASGRLFKMTHLKKTMLKPPFELLKLSQPSKLLIYLKRNLSFVVKKAWIISSAFIALDAFKAFKPSFKFYTHLDLYNFRTSTRLSLSGNLFLGQAGFPK